MSLREVFDQLCELAPEERTRRLREMTLPEGDRRRLEAMLAARTSDVFDHSLTDVLQGLQPDAQVFANLVGRRVGPFTIEENIGEGGSAAVFRAVRPAGSGQQEVALKVLRASQLSDDAARRFQREQAILAQLSHPSIARFIESGADPDGLSYIAMELVRGAPITQATADRRMGLRERLELLCQLCRAIQTAHASLVVHCDLKPSNILLDHDGTPKILDFGIARLVDGGGAAEVTRTLALTPEYAAPEQFTLAPPRVAIDIYAIGVLLGELVTGQRPGGARALRPSAAASAAVSLPPGLPERAALVRALQGDIDAIVAKATAHDPAERYRTAEALGEDIERHLAGLPIEARRISSWSRLGKLLRRHRVAAMLTTLGFSAVCSAAVIALVQAEHARRAAAAAKEQAARADIVRNLAFRLFSEAEPAGGQAGEVTVSEAVEHAITDLSADRVTPPRIRLDLLMRLAVTLGRQGHPERAQTLLETLHKEADERFGAHDLLTLSLAERIAKYEIERGAYASARQRVEALLAEPVALATPELRLAVLQRSAILNSRQGDHERALRDGQQAVDLARRSGDDANTAEALTTLAAALFAAGHVDEAANAYEELLALFKQRYGPVHEKVSLAYSGLARAYRRAGKLAPSEAASRAALDVDRAVFPKTHWVIASHLNALEMTLLQQRRFDEALQAAQEAAAIYATLGKDHVDAAGSKYDVGFLLHALGRNDEALPYLRAAFEEHLAARGEAASDTLRARAMYGFVQGLAGATHQGAANLDSAISTNRRRERPDHELLAKAIEKRLRLAIASRDPDAVEPLLAPLSQSIAQLAPADRAWWSGRLPVLRAALLVQRAQWQAAWQALDAGAAEIEACPDEALKVEYDLYQALVARRLGEATARQSTDMALARLKVLRFPPPQLLALARELDSPVP